MAEKSRKSFTFLGCSLCLALSAQPALGQSFQGQSFQEQSFQELEARLRRHPSLAAMRQHSDALRETAVAAAAWPDPVVSAGISNFPLFDPSFRKYLPTSKAIGVRQEIPNRPERQARSEKTLRQAAHNDAAGDFHFSRLRAELIMALVEQRRIAEQARLANQQDASYGELAQVIENELAAGRPGLFRLAGIDLERAELARALADLAGEAAQVKARLRDLVGEQASAPPPPIQPVDWSGDPMAFHAVRLAEREIAVADASVKKAQAAWRPDWGVQLTYQQRDRGGANTPFAGDDWVSAAVTFSVPLWARRSQAPALRAAKAQREAARSRYRAAVRGAAAQYSAFRAERLAAEAAIAALERKLAALDEQVAAQRSHYESGAGDYSPVIDGELARLVVSSRIAAQQARRDRAITQLNALMVTP